MTWYLKFSDRIFQWENMGLSDLSDGEEEGEAEFKFRFKIVLH
jgi:hypothetical protein